MSCRPIQPGRRLRRDMCEAFKPRTGLLPAWRRLPAPARNHASVAGLTTRSPRPMVTGQRHRPSMRPGWDALHTDPEWRRLSRPWLTVSTARALHHSCGEDNITSHMACQPELAFTPLARMLA